MMGRRTGLKERDLQMHAETYRQENDLLLKICFEMPACYEAANGMYEPESQTLFINQAKLESAPAYEALFYLYHELRHAVQYQKPDHFEAMIVRSLDYVVGHDGKCWKRINKTWKACRLAGSESYFTQMYLAQPNESDANAFAFQTVKEILGNSEALQALYSFWKPVEEVSAEQYNDLYRQIDRLTET